MALQTLPEPSLALLVAAVLALVGLAVAALAGTQVLLAYRLVATDPTPVVDLPNTSGPVEVRGTAGVHEDTLTAPFSGTPCLVCAWTVEEERTGQHGTYWEDVAAGREAVPFRVEDDTGSVLAFPAGLDSRLERERVATVPGGRPPPERIRRFVAEREDLDGEDTSLSLGPLEVATGSDRRYVEARLDPGERAYVYGEPVYDRGVSTAVGQVNARLEPHDGSLLVSDTDERGVARRVVRGALAPAATALAFLAGAGVVLVAF
ncbi:hypothetical protein [Halomarina ordinaria]|uniref:RING-type E3 ubiquitin transferase n=1 Tax=Halomarina ordinaria TaxID=3033939 RepID=A0ABD5U3G6_9EURY|nr:hypothetical protein [Halomarina sp. PSRA2]